MMVHHTHSCCGIFEIEGIRSFKDRGAYFIFQKLENGVADLADEDGCEWPALFIFTDAYYPSQDGPERSGTSGAKFAQYILDNNLGEVNEPLWETNPNSGALVAAWVWKPNTNAQAHYSKLQAEHNAAAKTEGKKK